MTLVEQAPEPRTGGYVIDFWAWATTWPSRWACWTNSEFRIVNRGGRRISGFNQAAVQKLIKAGA